MANAGLEHALIHDPYLDEAGGTRGGIVENMAHHGSHTSVQPCTYHHCQHLFLRIFFIPHLRIKYYCCIPHPSVLPYLSMVFERKVTECCVSPTRWHLFQSFLCTQSLMLACIFMYKTEVQ